MIMMASPEDDSDILAFSLTKARQISGEGISSRHHDDNDVADLPRLNNLLHLIGYITNGLYHIFGRPTDITDFSLTLLRIPSRWRDATRMAIST